MTTTTSDLGREAQNRGCNFHAIWEQCCSPIFRVVTEEGENTGDAQIRHFLGRHWLYVDDVDGYEIMDESEASNLHLLAEEESE